jgi:hypothetical protein
VKILLFARFSALSTLDEELERLKLEVWFVEMLLLTRVSALSTLEDELERLRLEA